jgi:TPR repeat protein
MIAMKLTRHLLIISIAFSVLPEVSWAEEKVTDWKIVEAKAADGDSMAQFELGRAYFRGEGVPKDEQKALAWTEKSAQQGNADAMTNLGYFYAQGIGVEKSEANAVEWFRKGAEAGSSKSQLNLGLMLRQGKSIERNHDESIRWLDKAAASGDPDAVATVGQLYFLGDALMMPDSEKAYPLLLLAAEAGNPACQNKMGLICREGIGPEVRHKDRNQALHWFRRAAEQGDAKGQFNLAHLMGVESPASENRQEALMWLYMAVDQGEPLADKTLKEIFMSVPPDLAQKARGDVARQLIINAARGTGKTKTAPASPGNKSAAPKTDE